MTVLAVLPGKAPEQMELNGSLESMQKFVGGTIQAMYPFSDPVAVVCHDEGKLLLLENFVSETASKGVNALLGQIPFLPLGVDHKVDVGMVPGGWCVS